MKRVLVAALIITGGQASAQETRTPADNLLSTQAQVCVFGDEAIFVPILESVDGSLQALGEWSGWQAIKADEGRVTLTAADRFLQMDGTNSLAVAEGRLRQGVCADRTVALRNYVSALVGGEGTGGVSSFRGRLLDQVVQERQRNAELRLQLEAAANEDAGLLRAALEAVRARNGELRRQLDVAEAQLRELEGRESAPPPNRSPAPPAAAP